MKAFLSLSAAPQFLAAAIGLAAPLAVQAATVETTCAGTLGHVKAVGVGARATNVNFSGTNGQLDPVPLLTTEVTVPRTTATDTAATCLIAHFSTATQPLDNAVVFQVRVDGVPMKGHSPDGPNSIDVPTISTPNDANHDYPYQRPVSYTFFSAVKPGRHTVDVLFAACCSANTGGAAATLVSAANLVVEFK